MELRGIDDREREDITFDCFEEESGPPGKSEDAEQCWQKAVQLLARQDYTKVRLQRKLAEKYCIRAVEKAIQRAEEAGYIDDHSYTERFVRSRKKDKSRQEIRQSLRERGIRIDEALFTELYTEEEEAEVARAVLERRYLRMERIAENPDELPWQMKRTLYQTLLRRGFSYSNTESVIRDLFVSPP